MGWLSFSTDDAVEGIIGPSHNSYSLSSYKAVMGVAYVLICLVVVVPSFALTQR